jgi:hypothetical protein
MKRSEARVLISAGQSLIPHSKVIVSGQKKFKERVDP